MRKTAILLIAFICLQACTAKQLYQNAAHHNKQKCERESTSMVQYNRCMEQLNQMSYEEYERQRREALEEKGDDK